FLFMATAMIWVGASWFTALKLSDLSALLGLLLMAYSGISLMGFRLDLTLRQERWLGPVVGAINGVLTGLTGSFVVPGVMFLQSIGFSRDQLIQSMGILFTLSTLALGFGLHRNNLLTCELGIVSSLSLLPAIVGMLLGQYIRKQMSETAFRTLFFSALLVLGLYIIFTSR
ncbi:MAG: TSUP family transporter, partial [Gammaproteobacteria bacterium]